MAAPAYAATTYCRMDGPHNCTQQNEEQLISITKNTINHMHIAHPEHAFKTQNDVVLENAARQHAQIVQTQPASNYYPYWR